jgi:hypothetical protein
MTINEMADRITTLERELRAALLENKNLLESNKILIRESRRSWDNETNTRPDGTIIADFHGQK